MNLRSGGRRRLRVAAVAVAAVAVVVAAGVGTASASDHGWWGHRPGAGRPNGHPGSPGGFPGRPGRPSVSPPVTTSPATTSPATTAPASPVGPSAPASSRPAGSPAPGGSGPAAVQAPPPNARFDYQISDPYPLPAGVQVVSRDRSAAPAAGAYNICYINAYQAQPEEAGWWQRNHPDLLLSKGGGYVVDENWNEIVFDISTADKRTRLLAIVGGWIDECAAKGYRAVEPDNLDSWDRSEGLVTEANAVAYATQLAAYAHARGLAIGQKNGLEIAGVGRRQVGFDFAIIEECADFTMGDGQPECQGYVDVYGDHIIAIEYDDRHFQAACDRYGGALSIVRRDVQVTVPGSSAYVYKSC